MSAHRPDSDPPSPTDAPERPSRRLLITIIATLVVAGSGVWIWDSVKYRYIPKRWRTVEAGEIYRSGGLSEQMVRQTWADHDIEVVLNLGVDKPGHRDHEAAIAAARDLGIERTCYGLRGDGTGDVTKYIDAIVRLAEARRTGKPVVVHCSAGVQRTGGVVASYRILVQGWSREDAYREMFKCGVDGPDEPVTRYLDENLPRIAEGLVAAGVIDEAPAIP